MHTEHSVTGCPDHVGEATVLDYLSGDGDAGERRRFGAHLVGCEACQSELQQWVVVREGIAAAPAPTAEIDFSTMDERKASLALAELEGRLLDQSEGATRRGGWRELLTGVRAPMPLYKLGWALSATLVVVVAVAFGVDRVGEWLVESDSRGRGFVSEGAPPAEAESTWSWASPRAARNVRRAMEGDADAQNALGRLYRRGNGVPRDLVLAHMWFGIASANGSDSARQSLVDVENEMTLAQIAEANRRAQACRESDYQDCGL